MDVIPVFPENQDPKIKNYISINTNEKHFKQNIEFIITNRSKKQVTIQIEKLNAINSSQKGIQYTTETEENGSRLLDERYALAKYIKIDKQITLKGKERKKIQAEIDIPKLDGTILGAIGFKTLHNTQEINDGQLQIRNELNRVIGVQINLVKNAVNDNPVFVVHKPYIEPMPAYYVIRLPIGLQSSLLLKDVLLKYKVFDSKGSLLFGSKDEQPFNFAPNTYTPFILPWQHDKLKENEKYVLKGELQYAKDKFTFEKTFKFETANVMTETNNIGRPDIIQDYSFYIWLVVLLIFVGGVAIYYLRRRKKQNSETSF